jgi:hypothetical protein
MSGRASRRLFEGRVFGGSSDETVPSAAPNERWSARGSDDFAGQEHKRGQALANFVLI